MRNPSKPRTLDEMLGSLEGNNSAFGLFMRCALERMKAGDDFDKAWRLALAERLTMVRREHWPRELLEEAAELLLEECEPKLKAEWQRSPERDRERIDALAEVLRARGVRPYRGEAEKIWADLQGVTVHALRQRRYRPRRRKKV